MLGASGMLGSACFRYFEQCQELDVVGTVRDEESRRLFPESVHHALIVGIDVMDIDVLRQCLQQQQPDLLINCIGVVKQLSDANDPLVSIPINSLLPHQLAASCRELGARLVHVSTDCVFSGATGGYVETDVPDATDLYGRSKLLGEVLEAPGLTLRTSIVGPEMRRGSGLLAWFLAQQTQVKGFSRAFFSGVTTNELARVIHRHVIPNPQLTGLYHVSAERISKLALLQTFARQYGHAVDIVPSDELVIDRSLDSSRFREATGYQPPAWDELVTEMVNINKRWGTH